MASGLETAIDESTLVLFTTLAPSGVFAYILIGGRLILSKFDLADRQRLNKTLVMPLVITLIGLIASATHLGNPANALYVFLGVGRSPLSTEVFCAVVFLALAGVYWLYSFSLKQSVTLQKVWLGVIIVVGVAFITSIAFAYDAETIISWNTVYVPLNLWLNAIVGGPVVALLTMQLAKTPGLAEAMFSKVLCVMSAGAVVLNTISMVLQNTDLPSIANSFLSAADLVPFYLVVILAFFILTSAGISLYALVFFKGRPLKLSRGIVACSFVLLGIFLTRFVFYMMHLTAGVGM